MYTVYCTCGRVEVLVPAVADHAHGEVGNAVHVVMQGNPVVRRYLDQKVIKKVDPTVRYK